MDERQNDDNQQNLFLCKITNIPFLPENIVIVWRKKKGKEKRDATRKIYVSILHDAIHYCMWLFMYILYCAQRYSVESHPVRCGS